LDDANVSEKAPREIITDPHKAVTTYAELRNLSNELASRSEKAWGSMIHLTEHVETSARVLWEEMEQILSVYVSSQEVADPGIWIMHSNCSTGQTPSQTQTTQSLLSINSN
jgi:hypothetical protein